MNLLYPRIAHRDLRVMLAWALVGGCIGGLYGIIHDQLTFSLSPEYFTRFKFRQFAWADFGQAPRIFAGTVGFFAAGSVGAGAAWFLARLAAPFTPSDTIVRALVPMGIVAAGGTAGGAVGFLLGCTRRANPDLSNWEPVLAAFDVVDGPGFVHVAYVHNAGYIGALAGLLVVAFVVRRCRRRKSQSKRPRT